MRHYIWLGILLLFGWPVNSVMACSGGGTPSLTQSLNHDFFVEATVLEVDEVGQNAILRVERYLKGVGTSYLAVVNYTRGFHAVDQRGYDKGCDYGVDYPIYQVGQHGFYGLSSRGDGTYDNTYGYASIFYPVVNGHITVAFYDDAGYREEELTVAAFEAQVHEILGQTTEFVPSNYNDSRAYPLLRPLYFITESGRRYVMEVDRDIREIDINNEPFAISPDGAHVAFYFDNDSITFAYCSGSICLQDALVYQYVNTEPPVIPGQAVAFSPNSNYVVTWDESSLGLYLFDNQSWSNYGRYMELVSLGNRDFIGELDSESRLVSWSGDSSTLVYLDDAGIWHWNIFTMTEPELLLSSSNLVTTDETISPQEIQFLELSESGRYLRYGNGNHWTLLDTIRSESFANAVVTPDESNFIYVNSELPDSRPDWSNCRPPFHQSCPFAISQMGELVSVEWLEAGTAIFYFCESASQECFSIALGWAWNSPNLSYGNWTLEWFENIAHSSYENERFSAKQYGDYELEIWYDALNEIETYHPETYDLSAQLDSPIAHIEWGQSIFYEER